VKLLQLDRRVIIKTVLNIQVLIDGKLGAREAGELVTSVLSEDNISIIKRVEILYGITESPINSCGTAEINYCNEHNIHQGNIE
jgi:hypothetical protein